MTEKNDTKQLIARLEATRNLSRDEWIRLIQNRTADDADYLFERAQAVRTRHYGRSVYIRGLIEFTNYCKNDCFYCGIRKSNRNANRYRLTKEQILSCCEMGYALGFRTFVLQGGEDGSFTDDRLTDIISSIRTRWSDCAITLSIGERSYESYKQLYDAGANRFLLRHETYDDTHYGKLHPPALSAARRKQCLFDLKKIGYQVGTGFMVGSPYQTFENLADTPFADQKAGSADLTLFLLGLIRLLLPKVLLPATTALGTIDSDGREKGILAGANVIMPNLSPPQVREKYLLYDSKLCTGDEAAESLRSLKQRIQNIGYEITVSRGDSLNI